MLCELESTRCLQLFFFERGNQTKRFQYHINIRVAIIVPTSVLDKKVLTILYSLKLSVQTTMLSLAFCSYISFCTSCRSHFLSFLYPIAAVSSSQAKLFSKLSFSTDSWYCSFIQHPFSTRASSKCDYAFPK